MAAAVAVGTRPATRTSWPPGFGGRPIFLGRGVVDILLTNTLAEPEILLTSSRAAGNLDLSHGSNRNPRMEVADHRKTNHAPHVTPFELCAPPEPRQSQSQTRPPDAQRRRRKALVSAAVFLPGLSPAGSPGGASFCVWTWRIVRSALERRSCSRILRLQIV